MKNSTGGGNDTTTTSGDGNNNSNTQSTMTKTKKEDEFHRIARQAREFREQETKRIAAEKVETERLVQLQKQAELDRVAQVTGTFLEQTALEKQQQQQQALLLLQGSDVNGIDSWSHHHLHHHGTVAEEAARLQRRQEDAERRRLEEEEFRRLHPHLGEEEFRKHRYQQQQQEQRQQQQQLESDNIIATTSPDIVPIRRVGVRETIELYDKEDDLSPKGKLLPGVTDLLSRTDVPRRVEQQTTMATSEGTDVDTLRNQLTEVRERYGTAPDGDGPSESSSSQIAHMVEEAEVQLHRYEDELEEQYTKVEHDLEEVDRTLHHVPDTYQPIPNHPDDDTGRTYSKQEKVMLLEARKSFIEKMVYEAELQLHRNEGELEAQFAKLDKELEEADSSLLKKSSAEKTVPEHNDIRTTPSNIMKEAVVVERSAQITTKETKSYSLHTFGRVTVSASADEVRTVQDYSSEKSPAEDGSSDTQRRHIITSSGDTGFTELDLELEVEEQESIERTRAMLAEDDVIPSGSYVADQNRENDKLYSRRNKKGALVVRTLPSPVRPKAGGTSKALDRNDSETKEIVHKEASFEVPIEITADGFKFSPKVADLSMMTTIPAARLGGRWSGTLEGKSNFGSLNNATGSASLEYKASKYSRITFGMIRGCETQHPLITVGGRLLRYGSSLGVTFYHNSAMMHQMIVEQSMWSLSYRHSFHKTKWSLSSRLSRQSDMSVSLSNGKLAGRIGWNWRQQGKFHVRVDARPRLSPHRKAHLYCQWRTGMWQFGVSLVQSLHSQVSTVGLGWRLFSARGFQWVISWNRGNATVRVPITISKGLSYASFGQAMYFSMISHLGQDCLAEMWGWQSSSTSINGSGAYKQLAAKARRDAAVQRELMTRQAKRKEKEEMAKDGLVIVEGLYMVEGGDDWDVTIPLQFWVSRSTLSLPGRSKGELLGFYDVTTSLKKNENTTTASVGLPFSWSNVWNDLFDWTSKGSNVKQDAKPTPKLTILYKMKSQLYRITVNDSSELKLPDPRAEIVHSKESLLSQHHNSIVATE